MNSGEYRAKISGIFVFFRTFPGVPDVGFVRDLDADDPVLKI
jgi:hypothetical protein